MGNADSEFDLRLGVEEVALAISLQGYPDAARALLVTTFGELPPDDQQGRLLAAGHSLMARGLLTVAGDESKLEPRFSHFLDAIVEPEFILQLASRAASGDTEHTLSYFMKGQSRIGQRIEQGVVYNLYSVHDQSEIIDAATHFFEIQQPDATIRHHTAEVPASTLDRARDLTVGEIERMFKEAQVPDTLAHMLAEDFANMKSRGMAMLIENRQGELVSDEGFLVMQGAQRTWLFPLMQKSGEAYAEIVSGSPDTLKRETQQLLAKTRQQR